MNLPRLAQTGLRTKHQHSRTQKIEQMNDMNKTWKIHLPNCFQSSSPYFLSLSTAPLCPQSSKFQYSTAISYIFATDSTDQEKQVIQWRDKLCRPLLSKVCISTMSPSRVECDMATVSCYLVCLIRCQDDQLLIHSRIE